MTKPKVSALRLLDAQTEYWDAEKWCEAKRQERNAMVRRALAEGWTHAQIAEATRLSRGRINQIAQSR